MSGERLPAAVAVDEDVGKADSGYDLAGSVDQSGQSARKSGVTLDVRPHFGKMIHARLAMRNVIQHLAASMQRAVDIGIFEFLGHHAGDGASVLVAKSRGPALFELNEHGLGLRLIFGAIGSKRGRREDKQNREQG